MQKTFSKAKKGYDTKEVDAFVKETEETVIRQKERIAELVKQSESNEAELKAFKQRQDLIVKSIMNAIAKAEQIESLTRQKYQSDMARLKAFHERWIGYYNKLLQKYPLDGELNALSAFNQNMTRILTGKTTPQQMTEAEEQFIRETERLKNVYRPAPVLPSILPSSDDEPTFNPEESIREMLRRQVDEEERKKQRAPAVSAKKDGKSKKTTSKKGDNSKKAVNSKAVKPSKSDKKNSAAPVNNGKNSAAPLNNDKKSAGYDENIRDFIPLETEEGEGFSYEEALNPTQELSDILRDLGLELKGEDIV